MVIVKWEPTCVYINLVLFFPPCPSLDIISTAVLLPSNSVSLYLSVLHFCFCCFGQCCTANKPHCFCISPLPGFWYWFTMTDITPVTTQMKIMVLLLLPLFPQFIYYFWTLTLRLMPLLKKRAKNNPMNTKPKSKWEVAHLALCLIYFTKP